MLERTAGVATHEILTMGVELSSEVTGLKVEQSLVQVYEDLKVGRRPQELNTGEGTRGYETATVAGLGAPHDFLALRVADGGWTSGGSPETEICVRMGINVRTK